MNFSFIMQLKKTELLRCIYPTNYLYQRYLNLNPILELYWKVSEDLKYIAKILDWQKGTFDFHAYY